MIKVNSTLSAFSASNFFHASHGDLLNAKSKFA
jgi:hypothetical protein